MSILYDLYISPTTNEQEETSPRYHARTVNRQTLDPDTLVSHICERSSLGKGDILALFEELNNEIRQQLLAGNSIYVPKIGVFSLSLQSPADINPQTARAEHIKVKRIEYRAESSLRNAILQQATFERNSEKKHSALLTNEEINEKAKEYLTDHPFLTRNLLEKVCNLTRGTALNHIRRMVKEEILINTNTPQQPIYVLKNYNRD